MDSTIIALSSAHATGAIAVIRMSGDNAVKIFSKLANNETFQHSQIKRFYLRGKNGEVIDDVMAAVFFAPNSFTGETVVEIYCHGGQITVERIIGASVDFGAVPAQRGEFTRRAFLNGKVDLHKAEAINALISANDYYSQKSAMSAYMGEGREFFDEIRNGLQKILVDIESEIEFSETDGVGDNSKIKENIDNISQVLSIQKEKYSRLIKVKNGIPTVLVGRTNAGKSSLFNRLLNENRAIVNKKAGTTRDIITETVRFDDLSIRLFDTAGFNKNVDEIENEGIARTKAEINKALAVLWVISPDDTEFAQDYESVKNAPVLIAVLNKSDLPQNPAQEAFLKKNSVEYLRISAVQNEGIENLIAKLKESFPEKDFNSFLTSRRELNIVESMLETANNIDMSLGIEILAENVREMLNFLGEIYGFMSPDEILNKIFDEFCIGK